MTCEDDARLMTSGGSPTERAQCPECCSVFSTATNYELHLMPAKVRFGEGYEGPWCMPPADVGLAQDELGVWHQPGAEGAELLPTQMVGGTHSSGSTKGAGGRLHGSWRRLRL